MTDWFEPFTRLTPPTDDIMWSKCRVGHEQHGTTIVAIDETHSLPMSTMEVYNWRDYGGDNLDWWDQYCPAQDIVSRSIEQTGMWEPYETALFVDILKRGANGVVIDFGCQLGWYTTLATNIIPSYQVVAIDVNAENVALTQGNAPGTRVLLGSVDEHAQQLATDTQVRVAKIDIEGAEQWAIRMLRPTLEARNIAYLIMEVSPVFNDTYPDLVEQVAGYGYDTFVIPHTAPRVDNPLEIIMRHPLVEADRRGMVAAMHQENLLFARRP